MTGDLLQNGEPKRLTCHAGRWFLEVERLVAIDANLFQPQLQRLEGVDAVLGFLKKNPNAESLLCGTQQLLKSTTLDEVRSFENVDGEWVPSAISPVYIKQLTHGRNGNAQQSSAQELSQLRAELLLLRASHERLKERVMDLERKFEQMRVSLRVQPDFSQGEVQILQSGQPRPDVVPRGEGADLRTGSRVRPAEAPQKPASAPAATKPAGHALTLPGADKLIEGLKTLLGDAVAVRKVEPTTSLDGPFEGFWSSRLADETGAQVGAILANLPCLVRLGGELMMLPESEIQQQIRDCQPSEDSVAAMSEVCNALAGVFHEVPGNPQVKNTYLEPHRSDGLSWLDGAKQVAELHVESGGILLLLVREA